MSGIIHSRVEDTQCAMKNCQMIVIVDIFSVMFSILYVYTQFFVEDTQWCAIGGCKMIAALDIADNCTLSLHATWQDGRVPFDRSRYHNHFLSYTAE
jgi:hypothetical protein